MNMTSGLQGLTDLLGRASNVAAGPQQASYQPQGGTGLSGIRTDLSQVGGAPLLRSSNARPVQGGITPRPAVNPFANTNPVAPAMYGVGGQ